MGGNSAFMDQSMKMSSNLIDIFKNDSLDEQEKQVLGAYLFGMFNGLAQELNINPVEVQSAVIQTLNGKLHYPLETAVQFSQFLINSTDRSFHPTMFAIIHRGLDGYFKYKDQNYNELEQDIREIITMVKEEV